MDDRTARATGKEVLRELAKPAVRKRLDARERSARTTKARYFAPAREALIASATAVATAWG